MRTISKRVRPRIGDIVRITTCDGAALAQCTHRHPQFGHLLRVIGAVEPTLAPNAAQIADIAARDAQFVTFFPLGAACARGIAEILGSAPIPTAAKAFPTFRAAMALPTGGRGPWWLWDGEREWRIGSLAPEQRHLPLREVINDTLLVERVLANWRPEADV